MSTAAIHPRTEAISQPAQFRYGAVFLIVLVVLVFEIVSPAGAWGRAVAVVLEGAALTVAVATSRGRGSVRRRRARFIAGAAALLFLVVGTGLLAQSAVDVALALMAVAIPVTLGGGLLRLIGRQGVTAQAVAGALAIYLLVGLVFASVVSFVAHVGGAPYFKQGSASAGDRVYYSFTVMTTTGFGDYTPATPVGHALAVLEMLSGQLYLVTVIGILVGNFAGRRMRDDGGG